METLEKSCEGVVRNREMPRSHALLPRFGKSLAITSIDSRGKTIGRSRHDWAHERRESLVMDRRTVTRILVNDQPLAISRGGFPKGGIPPSEYSYDERRTTHRVSLGGHPMV